MDAGLQPPISPPPISSRRERLNILPSWRRSGELVAEPPQIRAQLDERSGSERRLTRDGGPDRGELRLEPPSVRRQHDTDLAFVSGVAPAVDEPTPFEPA